MNTTHRSLLFTLALSACATSSDDAPTVGSGIDGAAPSGLPAELAPWGGTDPLQPGQAFTTPLGDFHWYAVHQAINPCVQVWVHRCVPSASAPSMACSGD